MKTFINVLYRRILYRIPLKFLLLLLAIFWLLFASFSSADNVATLLDTTAISQTNIDTNWKTLVDFGSNWDAYTVCFNYDWYVGSLQTWIGSIVDYEPWTNFTYWSDWDWKYVCFYKSALDRYLNIKSRSTTTVVYWDYFILNDLLATTLPVYTSLECQQAYSLIPISSVDQNYCITNNLCPSCPSCPSWWSGRSNVYINDILHVWAPNIVMNIAEEIDWDYEYTAWWNNMNIDVVWYNVDYEKIGEIIDNQNYKPSSEDFKNILWILAPYTKIIVFFVFLFLVWAWIKKPFKSKKL